MILNRLGNKKKLAAEIYPYFPPHTLYIELFFGAGGMFFNKPRARYNVCNDLDADVYNLWTVLREKPEELKRELEMLPVHEALWVDYKKKEVVDPVLKAVIFLMYSNFGYMGKPQTLLHESGNMKSNLIGRLKKALSEIQDVTFMCTDFRNVLAKTRFRKDGEKGTAFIYADPPYLGTDDNYSHSFTEQDTIDLFEILFAVSEFDHPVVMELAEAHGLNIIHICERQTMKSRNTEILITNYKPHQTLFELPPPPVSTKEKLTIKTQTQ